MSVATPREWSWGPEPHSLQIAGLSLGSSQLPPVVAIHGWLDNGASFLPLARLACSTHCWHLLDLPGHGHSQWLPSGHVYHFIDWIAYLAAYLDECFSEPVVLVGHSMGAGIAPLLAVARPDKVSQLVLLDGLGPLSSKAEDAVKVLLESLEKPWPVRPEPARPFQSLRLAAQVLAKPRGLQPEQLWDLAVRAVEMLETGPGESSCRLRHDPRLKMPSRLRITEEQTRAFLSQVQQPTLLVVPEEGYFVKAPEWQARQPLLQRLTVKPMAGGHHAHLENPSLVLELVEQWRRELG